MRVELQALQRVLGQSPVAESLAKLAFSQLDAEMEKTLADGLETALEGYSKCHIIDERLAQVKDLGTKYSNLAEVHPISLCALSIKLLAFENQPKALVRYLCVVSDYLVNQTMSNSELHLPILDSLSVDENATELKQKIENPSHMGYFPRLLRLDFQSLAEVLAKYPPLKGRQDAIETLYFMRALTAIYYRIFFHLLVKAKKDVIAEHLTALFSTFFVAMRKFEINTFIKGPIPAAKIDYIIDRDDVSMRHPLLRKHIFGMLVNYNPLLSDGKGQNLNVTGQKNLRGQLTALQMMTDHRLTLFMLVVKRYRGKAYVQSLLSSLQRTGANRISKFQAFLSEQAGKEAQEVLEEVDAYVARITGRAPGKNETKAKLLVSQEALRLAEAKRKMAANKNRKMMSQHDVEAYLKARLAKLFEQVRREGALTKDKIPEYLARFAESTQNIMHDRALTDDDVAEFEASTSGLLDDIAREANVDRASLVVHEQEILQHTSELKDAAMEDRANIVSNIGVVLLEAQKHSEKQKPKEVEDVAGLLKSKIISIGLEDNAPKIPVSDFFAFPLGPRKGPETDEVWFDKHVQYLGVLNEKGRLPTLQHEKIVSNLDKFAKFKYRKYFDIFPGDAYEDTVMMAVFSLWENQALNTLKVSS